MKKLNAKQLRASEPTKEEIEKVKRSPIYLVLDRITDTYNIGSIFRLADAIAVEKIYLCGDMEFPPNSRIHKAAVGTEAWVPWEKTDSTLETIKKLKGGRRPGPPVRRTSRFGEGPLARRGVQIIAIEQDKRSTDYRLLTSDKIKFPVAIVCGNETRGLSKKVLDEADIIAELPMMGINKSFNVWGSTAVVAYKILESY